MCVEIFLIQDECLNNAPAMKCHSGLCCTDDTSELLFRNPNTRDGFYCWLLERIRRRKADGNLEGVFVNRIDCDNFIRARRNLDGKLAMRIDIIRVAGSRVLSGTPLSY